MEYFETLKEYTKRMPCFTCVVRTPCSFVGENGQVIVQRKDCPHFVKWQQGRDELVFGTADKIMALAIAEVRNGERASK